MTKFKCGKCGGKFLRAAALGSHRFRAHGIKGKNSHPNGPAKAKPPANGQPTVQEYVAARQTVREFEDRMEDLGFTIPKES